MWDILFYSFLFIWFLYHPINEHPLLWAAYRIRFTALYDLLRFQPTKEKSAVQGMFIYVNQYKTVRNFGKGLLNSIFLGLTGRPEQQWATCGPPDATRQQPL